MSGNVQKDPLEERDIQKVLGALDDIRVQEKIIAIVNGKLFLKKPPLNVPQQEKNNG